MRSKDAGQEPARAVVHILSVPMSGYAIVCFAGPVRGIMMHWARGGSLPCLPGDDCPPAIHRSGTTWKGYAPVRCWDHAAGAWTPYALEVTEALEEVLRGRDLRGETWRLSRIRRKRKPGSVQGTIEERRQDESLLVPFDVRPVIERRYHCTGLVWDVLNPIVPKLTVEPATAPPPASIPILNPYQPAERSAPPDPAVQGLPMSERFRRQRALPAAEPEANGVHDGQ